MEDLDKYDDSDEEVILTNEQKVLIDFNSRMNNIEKNINILNKDVSRLVSHMNNIIYVLNCIDNNKIILNNIKYNYIEN